MTTIKEASCAVEETVLAAKGAAQEMRRSASQMLGQAGARSEGTIHSVASTVRNAGMDGAAVIDGIGERAGHRFATASSYLDSHDSGGMIHDLRQIVRRHPGSFLFLTAAVAGTVGFMAARNKVCSRD